MRAKTTTLTFVAFLAGCGTVPAEPNPDDPAARMVQICETSLGGRQQPAFDNCLIQQLQIFAAERAIAKRERDSDDFWRYALGAGLIGAGNGLAQPQPYQSPYAEPLGPRVLNCYYRGYGRTTCQ